MTDHDPLRAQLEALERSVPSALPPSLPEEQPTGPRWLAMAAVLAVGIAIGIGGGRLLGEIGEPTSSGTPEPSATADASGEPSAAPTATPGPTPAITLTEVPTTGLEATDDLRAILATDAGFVGVGHHDEHAAVWTSEDGSAWVLASAVPVASESYPFSTLDSVVAGPGGLVAIGGYSGIDFVSAFVWHSADGQTWQSVYGGTPSLFSRMTALTVGGSGYLSVGLTSADGYTAQPQIWSSVDGQTWTPGDSTVFRGSLNSVVDAGGTLVVVGGDEHFGTAYVSSDGVNWTAAPEQADLQGAELTSVTYFDGTFVAVGSVSGSPKPTPAIWHSSDGLQWSRVVHGQRGQTISQVIPMGGGFMAIGGLFPSHGWSHDPAAPIPPSDTVQIWISADGTAWDGPHTAYIAAGGVTLRQAIVARGLLLPILHLNPGPDGPVYLPAILRGLEWAVG